MNTISTKTYRDKYRLKNLDKILRKAMVGSAICAVDYSNNKTIQNPYGSQATPTISAITGEYTVDAYTTTDDTLTVDQEIKVAEHVYDFEETLTNFDIFSNRMDEQQYGVAYAIDQFVINALCEDGTGTYTTPVGGFTTAGNVMAIFANLVSKVAGLQNVQNGLYIVLENTDLPGLILAGANSGFNFADGVLKNGFYDNLMGVDIYIVRAGSFVDATIGTKVVTNAGHRVFGVKKVATLAHPSGVKFEEKAVSLKTGMEVVTYGYFGFKQWAVTADLTVDITIA